MARAHDLHRPSWWGPDWLSLPVAFWLSVLTSAAITGVLEGVLLRLLFPSLYRPYAPNPRPLATGDYYAAFTCAVGALPTLQLWKRALHRRGLHSWDDDPGEPVHTSTGRVLKLGKVLPGQAQMDWRPEPKDDESDDQ